MSTNSQPPINEYNGGPDSQFFVNSLSANYWVDPRDPFYTSYYNQNNMGALNYNGFPNAGNVCNGTSSKCEYTSPEEFNPNNCGCQYENLEQALTACATTQTPLNSLGQYDPSLGPVCIGVMTGEDTGGTMIYQPFSMNPIYTPNTLTLGNIYQINSGYQYSASTGTIPAASNIIASQMAVANYNTWLASGEGTTYNPPCTTTTIGYDNCANTQYDIHYQASLPNYASPSTMLLPLYNCGGNNAPGTFVPTGFGATGQLSNWAFTISGSTGYWSPGATPLVTLSNGNQYTINGGSTGSFACACPNIGQAWVTSISNPNGGSCECPTNAINGNTECVCPLGSFLSINQFGEYACTCSPGYNQDPSNGVCGCPAGAISGSTGCVCPSGSFLTINALGEYECTCAYANDGYTYCTTANTIGTNNVYQCVAPNSSSAIGSIINPETCYSQCPSFAINNNGICNCPTNTLLNSAGTECAPLGANIYSCPEYYYYYNTIAGACDQCPTGSFPNAGNTGCNACTIPGQSYVYTGVGIGSCVCPDGTYLNRGSTGCMSCPSGQIANASSHSCILSCPPNSTTINNSCVCNTGYTMNSLGVCANCPTNSSAVGNSCLCNSGYIMNSAGVCVACSSNSTAINNACVCNSGYTMNSAGGCIANITTSTCPANSSGSPCACNTNYYANTSTGVCYQCLPPGTWSGTSCR